MNDPEPPSAVFIETMARAYRRLCGVAMTYPPDYYDRERAIAMIAALHAEHLKVVPEDIDDDMTSSERGA